MHSVLMCNPAPDFEAEKDGPFVVCLMASATQRPP